MNWIRACICLLSFTLLSTSSEALQYRIVDLGPFPDNSYCTATAINNRGWIVGNYLDQARGKFCGFLWRDGVLQDLSTIVGHRCEAYGINDNGDIVGTYDIGLQGYTHAFVFRRGGLEDLGAPTGHYSTAYGINEAGTAIGTSLFPYSFCIWSDSATQTPFSGDARAVNEQGHVVGSYYNTGRAVLWSNGQTTDLGTYGAGNSQAYAINDCDQVVGTNGTGRAFLWQSGSISELSTFYGYGSTAYGINNNGYVVGAATTASGGYKGFVWRNSTAQYLGALPGGSESIAFAINDNGWIAGTASGADRRAHAVLWTPVPEPSSILVLLASTGGLAGVAGRKRSGHRSPGLPART